MPPNGIASDDVENVPTNNPRKEKDAKEDIWKGLVAKIL